MEISQCENEVAQTESIFCPLDAEVKEIRLVRLDFDRGDDIHMSMKHVRLIDNPDFIALSYVWGDAIPTYPVHINYDGFNGDVHIRENLHDFLAQIQQERDDQWYWIDQICINQADTEEKSHQVFQMADVFSQARQVTGWLGTGFGREDELVHLFSHEAFREYDLIERMIKRNSVPEKYKTIFTEQRPIFELFMKLPYWSRTWIRQEIGIAPTFQARLGSTAFLAQNLENTFFFFFTVLGLLGVYSTLASKAYSVWSLLCHDGAISRETLDWYTVLVVAINTNCADIRDYAYAGLGLLPSELRIKPNYTIDSTAMTIVLDITRTTLKHTLRHLATDYKTRKRRRGLVAATIVTLENTRHLVDTLIIFRQWYVLLRHRDPASFDDKGKITEFLRLEVLAPMRHRRYVEGGPVRLPSRAENILIRLVTRQDDWVATRFDHGLYLAQSSLAKISRWKFFRRPD